jgi:two-component system, sporulation sensor kinase E
MFRGNSQLPTGGDLNEIQRIVLAINRFEVRNPLATIRLQICQRNCKIYCMNPVRWRSKIERLNSIVGRLLNFAEPMSLHVQPTKLDRLVEQRLAAFREAAQKRSVRFITDFRGDGNTLSLDQARMAQVFDNVIQNAIEAMSEGDSLSTVPSMKSIRTGESTVWIEYRDTGKGISSGLIGRIFDRFSRPKSLELGWGFPVAR